MHSSHVPQLVNRFPHFREYRATRLRPGRAHRVRRSLVEQPASHLSLLLPALMAVRPAAGVDYPRALLAVVVLQRDRLLLVVAAVGPARLAEQEVLVVDHLAKHVALVLADAVRERLPHDEPREGRARNRVVLSLLE